jgi:hypothetical protein
MSRLSVFDLPFQSVEHCLLHPYRLKRCLYLTTEGKNICIVSVGRRSMAP